MPFYDTWLQATDRSVAVYPLPQGRGLYGAGCASVPGAQCPYGAGLVVLPPGAGAAGGQFDLIRQYMNAIAPLWGQPADAFDHFDWDDFATVQNARMLLAYALVTECGIPVDAARQSFRHLEEPGAYGGPDAFFRDTKALIDQWCPGQPVRLGESTYTGGPQADEPPTGEIMIPPAEEEKKLPWGWIAAGAGVLLLGGVFIYMATRPTKRRRNPSRRRRANASAPRRRRRRSSTRRRSNSTQVIILPSSSSSSTRRRKKRKTNAAPKRRKNATRRASPKRTRRAAPKKRRNAAPKKTRGRVRRPGRKASSRGGRSARR